MRKKGRQGRQVEALRGVVASGRWVTGGGRNRQGRRGAPRGAAAFFTIRCRIIPRLPLFLRGSAPPAPVCLAAAARPPICTLNMSSDSFVPPAAIEWRDDGRRAQFERWLALMAPAHGLQPASLRAASADASFRRYFRVDASGPARSFVIMDAPPEHEDCAPFVSVCGQLHQGGVHVPQVLSWQREHGFLLLSDLGDQTYLSALRNPATGGQRAHELMLEALDALVRLQQVPAAALPPYDEALQRREMDLFDSWYLERHLGLTLSGEQREQLAAAQALILANTLAQPPVFVHRDFHSRNLM
ncbi:MAG: phosphotransferase, partial [Rhizobacter sp.]